MNRIEVTEAAAAALAKELSETADLLEQLATPRGLVEARGQTTLLRGHAMGLRERAAQQLRQIQAARTTEPSDSLFSRVLSALTGLLDGLDAFADEDRPDPEPEQWAARLSEARAALTHGLLGSGCWKSPPTEGKEMS